MEKLVFVCQTCDRNAPPAAGARSLGAALGGELREYLKRNRRIDLAVRQVACLNGCLKPCNVSFRGPDRYTYRFSLMSDREIPSIVAFGGAYWSDPAGAVDAARIPHDLRAKMTVCTPPRGRW